jgi:hypothetical protein
VLAHPCGIKQKCHKDEPLFRIYFLAAVQFGSVISTRRFFALPASAPASAMGLVFP